jgi:hypothetical protein
MLVNNPGFIKTGFECIFIPAVLPFIQPRVKDCWGWDNCGRPRHISDLSLVDIVLQDIERKIVGSIIIEYEMFNSHQQIEFNPFPQPPSLIPKHGRDSEKALMGRSTYRRRVREIWIVLDALRGAIRRI